MSGRTLAKEPPLPGQTLTGLYFSRQSHCFILPPPRCRKEQPLTLRLQPYWFIISRYLSPVQPRVAHRPWDCHFLRVPSSNTSGSFLSVSLSHHLPAFGRGILSSIASTPSQSLIDDERSKQENSHESRGTEIGLEPRDSRPEAMP